MGVWHRPPRFTHACTRLSMSNDYPPHHRDGTHARHMQGYRKSLMQIRHKQVQAYSNCSRGAQAYDADFPAEVHKYTVQVSQHTRVQPPLRLQYMADNTQSSPHTQYRQTSLSQLTWTELWEGCEHAVSQAEYNNGSSSHQSLQTFGAFQAATP